MFCKFRVLSGHPLGMAYWPLSTDWPLNKGLTNVRVIQENEASQRAKYLSRDKLTSTCFYLFLGQKKKVKVHLTSDTVRPVALKWYFFSKRPFNRGEDHDFRDFGKWLLNRGWPLNRGPLNTDILEYSVYHVYSAIPFHHSVSPPFL